MELYSIQEIAEICDKKKSRMSQIIKELSYDPLSENESKFKIYNDEYDKRKKLYNREDTLKIIKHVTKLEYEELNNYYDLKTIDLTSFYKHINDLKDFFKFSPHEENAINILKTIESKYKNQETKFNKEISELHQEIYENEDEISTLKSRLRHELRNNETISQNNKRWIEQNEELRNELNTLKMRNNLK